MFDTNKITYRYINEAQGGTFHFKDRTPQENFTHIGTNGLITCVGVYIPIDDTTCFFAHISAYVDNPNDPFGKFDDIGSADLRSIRRQVADKLRQHAIQNGWSQADVIQKLNQGRKVVLMCPSYTITTGRAGPHVVQGIKDFLGAIPANCILEHYDDLGTHGFVVDHKTGLVTSIVKGPEDDEDQFERSMFHQSKEWKAEKGWMILGNLC